MSKKSTSRYESEGDAESASFRERYASTRSTISFSSAKEDSSGGPSGDYECSNSTSPDSSICASRSPRIKSKGELKREFDDTDVNSMYLNTLSYLRKQLNLDGSDADLTDSPRSSESNFPGIIFGSGEDGRCGRRYGGSHSGRKLSTNVCTLHIIEEKDECSCTSKENFKETAPDACKKTSQAYVKKAASNSLSLSRGSSKKCSSKNSISDHCSVSNCLEENANREGDNKTPRFYEVPPKRMCIREKTPDIDSPKSQRKKRGVNEAKSEDVCTSCSSKKYTINSKTYVLRKTVDKKRSTACTQVSSATLDSPNAAPDECENLEVESLKLNLDRLSINDSPRSHGETFRKSNTSSESSLLFTKCKCSSSCGSLKDSSNKILYAEASTINIPYTHPHSPRTTDGAYKNKTVDLSMHLPSSIVEETNTQTAALEPNIVILDTADRSKRKKKRQKDFRMGDASSDSENLVLGERGGKNTCGNSNSGRSSSRTASSILKKYCAHSTDISSKSTPTYTVSPMIVDKANQEASSESMSSSLCSLGHCNDRAGSQAQIDEKEIRTSEPDSHHSEEDRWSNERDNKGSGLLRRVRSYKSLKSLKRIIGNFAEGVKPTRQFPANFEDIDDRDIVILNGKADALKSPTFKEKGSELLQYAGSRSSKTNSVCNQIKSPEFLSICVNSTEGSVSVSKKDSREDGERGLIDARRNQTTDVDYYMVQSASSSEDEEDPLPGLGPQDIRVDEESPTCCGCFKFGGVRS